MHLPFAEQLNRISNFNGTDIYIVGGYLRDQLIGRESYDVDLVVERDPRSVGMSLADYTGGNYYDLNLEHATARVNLYWDNVFWQVDIGSIRGSSLMEDLKNRDFTVNAMALPVQEYLRQGSWYNSLLDPLGGRKDLESALIRAGSRDAIREDPLRMLRGIRLSAQLNFQIEEKTLQLFRSSNKMLSRLAGERIKMEWGKLLELQSAPYFKLMKDLNFLETLFPGLGEAFLKSEHRGSNGWEHSLATLHHLEYLLHRRPFPSSWKRLLGQYLKERLRGGWNREQLLKLAALLQNSFMELASADMEKLGEAYYTEADRRAELFSRYTRRLRLSRQERNMLYTLTVYYLHPLLLYKTPERTGRTMYRFYRQLGREAPGVILLSLAGHHASLALTPKTRAHSLPMAAEYRKFAYNLLNRYLVKESRFVHPPSLVTGNEIISLLNIKEGRMVGKILELIAEAQAEGIVTSRKEAFQLAEEEYRRLSSEDGRI